MLLGMGGIRRFIFKNRVNIHWYFNTFSLRNAFLTAAVDMGGWIFMWAEHVKHWNTVSGWGKPATARQSRTTPANNYLSIILTGHELIELCVRVDDQNEENRRTALTNIVWCIPTIQKPTSFPRFNADGQHPWNVHSHIWVADVR